MFSLKKIARKDQLDCCIGKRLLAGYYTGCKNNITKERYFGPFCIGHYNGMIAIMGGCYYEHQLHIS